jgi:hypothetical protein
VIFWSLKLPAKPAFLCFFSHQAAMNEKCKILFINLLQNFASVCKLSSGERGIRTPGPVTVNGFQDRRIRPLCHLSGAKIGGEIKRKKLI